jgi:hypothetical protein
LGPGVNCMERSEAVAVFDDYNERHLDPLDHDNNANLTQRIVIQAPRVSLPKAGQR